MEFTSGDRDVLALHIARHMEEIALAILPSGVESDEESACDSASDSISTDSYYTPRARRPNIQRIPPNQNHTVAIREYNSKGL